MHGGLTIIHAKSYRPPVRRCATKDGLGGTSCSWRAKHHSRGAMSRVRFFPSPLWGGRFPDSIFKQPREFVPAPRASWTFSSTPQNMRGMARRKAQLHCFASLVSPATAKPKKRIAFWRTKRTQVYAVCANLNAAGLLAKGPLFRVRDPNTFWVPVHPGGFPAVQPHRVQPPKAGPRSWPGR